MAPPRGIPDNPDKARRLERRRAWYATNRAAVAADARAYREERGDEIRARARARYAALTDSERAAFLAHRAELARKRRQPPPARPKVSDAQKADAAARLAEAVAVQRAERAAQRAALAQERLARANARTAARLAAREATWAARVAHKSAEAGRVAAEAKARWQAAEAHVLALLTGQSAKH